MQLREQPKLSVAYPYPVQNPTKDFRLSVSDLAQAAVFAALIAVLGIPGKIELAAGIPITFQALGVMLAGAILGPKKGTLAVVIFMALAIAGLPILAGGRNGMTSLSSVTGGYFVGFLPAVFVIGLLTAMMMPRYNVIYGFLINAFGIIVIDYACGILGLILRTDDSLWHIIVTTHAGLVPGDLIKAAIAAIVAAAVHRGRPGLITPWRPKGAVAVPTDA